MIVDETGQTILRSADRWSGCLFREIGSDASAGQSNFSAPLWRPVPGERGRRLSDQSPETFRKGGRCKFGTLP